MDCQIWVIEDSDRKRVISPPINFTNVRKAVAGLLKAQTRHFDVCICHGVRSKEETCKGLLALLKSWTGDSQQDKIFKLILVTSHQYTTSDGDSPAGDDNMIIDSWREKDYEKAVLRVNKRAKAILLDDWKHLKSSQIADDPTQSDDHKLLHAVRQKYEYAGGCARYMFDKNMKQLRTDLNSKCGSVADWTVFATTSMPDSTSDAVSSLMQQFYSDQQAKSLFTPVSKYVLLQAYTKCRDQLTDAIKTVAHLTKNDSLFGWAFELRQKDIIYSVLTANLAAQEANRKRTKGNVVRGVQNSKVAFFPVAEAFFDGYTIKVKGGGNIVSGSVIWCTEYNQELFDAAFYFENMLVTLQFIVAEKKHSLRLEHVKPIRTEIMNKGGQVERIVHLGIVTKEKFKFSVPTGVVEGITTYSDALKDANWAALLVKKRSLWHGCNGLQGVLLLLLLRLLLLQPFL